MRHLSTALLFLIPILVCGCRKEVKPEVGTVTLTLRVSETQFQKTLDLIPVCEERHSGLFEFRDDGTPAPEDYEPFGLLFDRFEL